MDSIFRGGGGAGDLYAERLIREYIRNYREGWIATDRDG